MAGFDYDVLIIGSGFGGSRTSLTGSTLLHPHSSVDEW